MKSRILFNYDGLDQFGYFWVVRIYKLLEIMFCWLPPNSIDYIQENVPTEFYPIDLNNPDNWSTIQKNYFEKTRAVMQGTKWRQKLSYDHSYKAKANDLMVGDKIILSSPNKITFRLGASNTGPFIVITEQGDLSYLVPKSRMEA